jgi:hypothetical protein
VAVLQKVKALAEAAKAKAGGDGGKAITLADLGISGVHEVAELTPDEVMVRHRRQRVHRELKARLFQTLGRSAIMVCPPLEAPSTVSLDTAPSWS